MPDQYRRDYEHERSRGGWSEPGRGERGRDDERLQRGGEWRGGPRERWDRGREDERSYALSERGGIARETGFDRGMGRDEGDSRDWQQRVGEDKQGYRDQVRQHDGGWRDREPEPDWRAGRFREREQERFGTGGTREYEQDWTDASAARGREGGSGPGGGWPWGGGGGPMSTWGIGGSASPRGIGGTREGAWPGYAGRGPKGYKRSDDRIREEVSDRLTDDHDVDATEITVDVKDGEVTLTGTVATREQKRWAEELVERVSCVSEVNNNLRVNRQPGGQAWQTMGQPGSHQVGQQVPIGGQQSVEGIRAGRDPQGQSPQATHGGQAATQAGQRTGSAGPQAAQPDHQDPRSQGIQAGGSRSNRATQVTNS